jgi:hypothetical protein
MKQFYLTKNVRMKKTVCVLCSAFFCCLIHAQKLKPEIISSDGGLLNDGSVKVTFTMGEPVTGKIAYGNVVLSQGFQQNRKTTATALYSDLSVNPFKIDVYPNPVKNFVTISLRTAITEPMMITLFDMNGKTLFQQTMQSNTPEQQVNMANFPEGFYLIRFNTLTGKPCGTFKIKKSN